MPVYLPASRTPWPPTVTRSSPASSRISTTPTCCWVRCSSEIRGTDFARTPSIEADWNVAATASATASLACVATWHEDFRKDLERVDVPILIVHGDDDHIVPLAAAGARTAKMITGARLHVVKGGPHGVTWTHAEEVNTQLLSFLGEKAQVKKIVA